eukprot:scaffold78784_cov82-Phaeocystis_antarctica.AAC.1
MAGAPDVARRVAHGVLHAAAARRARGLARGVEGQAEPPLHDDAHRPRRHAKLAPYRHRVEHVARVRLARRDKTHHNTTLIGHGESDSSVLSCVPPLAIPIVFQAHSFK